MTAARIAASRVITYSPRSPKRSRTPRSLPVRTVPTDAVAASVVIKTPPRSTTELVEGGLVVRDHLLRQRAVAQTLRERLTRTDGVVDELLERVGLVGAGREDRVGERGVGPGVLGRGRWVDDRDA